MLRKYCVESERHWHEGITFVLFALHDLVQEAISPAELVFGHTPCRQLYMICSGHVKECVRLY